MRVIFIFLLAASCAGCTRKADPQIAELKSRIEVLESDFAVVRTNAAESLVLYRKLGEHLVETMTNNVNLRVALERYVSEWEADRSRIESELALLRTNRPALRAYRPTVYQSAASAPRNAYGIPANIYDEIKREAIRRWPNDYRMQQYTIDEEVAAFRKVNP